MRRSIAFGLVAVLTLSVPAGAIAAGRPAAGQQDQLGTLKGIAKDSKGQNLARVTVRVRNTVTGTVQSEVVADMAGGFSATLTPGTYVVEIVSSGSVIGLSPAIAVAAGTTATVTVTATALGAVAAAGAAAGGVGLFGLGTAATFGVLGAAAVGGVLGVRAATKDASPSGQ
jgi:hypothetical protein